MFKSALIIAAAALCLLLNPVIHNPYLELLTGDSHGPLAQWAWSVAASTVGTAAIVLLLLSHGDIRLAREHRGTTRGGAQLLLESLGFISIGALLALLVAFTIVDGPVSGTHVLDMIGRAAGAGTIIGLAIAAVWGARWYVVLVPKLSIPARIEAAVVLTLGCLLFPFPWN